MVFKKKRVIQSTAGTPSRSPRPPIIYGAFLCEGLPPVFFPPCSLALPLLSGGRWGRGDSTFNVPSRLSGLRMRRPIWYSPWNRSTLRRTSSASVRHPDPRLECQTQQPVWGRRRRKIPQAFLFFFAPSHHPCRWTLCHGSSIWYQVNIKYGDSRWTSINSFASQLRSPR